MTAITTSLKYYSSIKDYIALMKPRVMSLVVFTAYVGAQSAPGHIHPLIMTTAIICITLGAGSAAAINMWYDLDIDSIMSRTQGRPVVTGKIAPEEALSFGVILGFFSSFMMALCVNLCAAGLLVFTILYYVFVYTIWLKRRSPQNVVIGGVAGALPPMIGWAAVTGGVTIESIALSAIIFMWTPPHSWALALYRIKDYKNCHVPMMPIAKGVYYCKIQILLYTFLMIGTSLLPFFINMAGKIYFMVASCAGLMFLYYSIALFSDDDNNKAARKLFIYSILYLFIIFLSLLNPV
ncbi:Protoheme IX farnesyltransferase [Candidatus Trichorickettsia mobilis]|uniref:Protoheme IX farnesyltransferase n=1 Tax=Candidatus Trichorickettsia mobilis TaxID=1346319 RepID=A0ABZ0UTH4_9RICK|nr:heme o synthase [Candidatus Trichorickettsia mobilis]WPY01322.1 Protoheme IX farnesyltransferase [Candidatus Trichorickettsia mobilis]